MHPSKAEVEEQIRARLLKQGLTPLEYISDKMERFNLAGVQSQIDADRVSVVHIDLERTILEGRLKEFACERSKTTFLFRWRSCDVVLSVFGYMLADPTTPVFATDFGLQVADWEALDAPVVPLGLPSTRGFSYRLHS